MASLLAIYGDRESCKIMIKVVFVISVDDIRHNEAQRSMFDHKNFFCSLALKHCIRKRLAGRKDSHSPFLSSGKLLSI